MRQKVDAIVWMGIQGQTTGRAMRNIILILLLAVVSSNAMAEWVAVNHNKYATGYADPATIVKDGNIAKMWSMVVQKRITYFIGGYAFKSIKSQEEFDCKVKKMRTLVYSLHPGKMGEGKAIFSDSNPGKWEPVQPDSVMGDFLKIACGKK
jgi:hypothetical protein